MRFSFSKADGKSINDLHGQIDWSLTVVAEDPKLVVRWMCQEEPGQAGTAGNSNCVKFGRVLALGWHNQRPELWGMTGDLFWLKVHLPGEEKAQGDSHHSEILTQLVFQGNHEEDTLSLHEKPHGEDKAQFTPEKVSSLRIKKFFQWE